MIDFTNNVIRETTRDKRDLENGRYKIRKANTEVTNADDGNYT